MRAPLVKASFVVFIAGLLGVFIPQGEIHAKNIYTVDNVLIGASGNSAKEAREKAIESGQLKAFHLLVQKLVVSPVKEGPAIAPAELARAVQSFEVSEEKIASNRYQSLMSITFNPSVVKSLLGNANIAFSENNAVRTLIIPVFKEKDKVILWETGNSWRDSISAALRSAGTNRFLLPMGDLEDMAALDKGTLDAPDSAKLTALAEKYGVENILIATASVDAASNALHLAQTMFDSAQRKKSSEKEFPSQEGQALPALLGLAAKELLPEAPKAVPVVNQAVLDVTITIADLKEWADIRASLERMENIEKMTVRLLEINEVSVTLHYRGTVATLSESLIHKGWHLRKRGNHAVLERSQPSS